MSYNQPFNIAFIAALKNGTWPPSGIGEQSQQLAKHLQVVSRESVRCATVHSFVLPTSLLLEDLSESDSYPAGASKPSSLIELLAPFSAVASFRPTVLNGLTSDVALPGDITVGAAGGWSDEPAAIDGVNGIAAAVPVELTPRPISVPVRISQNLLRSTRFDFRTCFLRPLYAALGLALDRAVLLGNGKGNVPQGILNVAGTNAPTFGGAASWTNILRFQSAVGRANGARDKLGWLGSNNAREKLEQTPKSAKSNSFIWEHGKVGDYRAETSSWLDSGDQLIFGAWDALVIGLWLDGISVLVNRLTDPIRDRDADMTFTAAMYMDAGVLRPALFSVSTDSAAQ